MREEEEGQKGSKEDGFEWIDSDKGKKPYSLRNLELDVDKEEKTKQEKENPRDGVDDFINHINESLSSQIREELGEEPEIGESDGQSNQQQVKKVRKPLWKRILIITGIALGILLLLFGFFFGTKPGRKLMYDLAARYMHGRFDNVEPTPSPTPELLPTIEPENPDTPGEEIQKPEGPLLPRQEDYVMTCLLFGLEEIGGARNTDSMMLAAINTKDKTVKLASIMRDSYVELPGYRPSKLNAVFAKGSDRAEGAALLVQAIEQIYHIKIDAYASVNFNSFEDIVDLLGGVTIELTATERDYLNKENYISNPKNRNVRAGVQTLNGNQVVGYCRVRYVPTLGGAANDYGRTLRQRRVMNAIFDKYKSKNLFELISIADTCLGYVTSNLTPDLISKGLEMIVEDGITELESARFPAEDTYYDCGTTPYNGIKYTLVSTNPLENTSQMFQFIFGDTKEEADLRSANYYEPEIKAETSDEEEFKASDRSNEDNFSNGE